MGELLSLRIKTGDARTTVLATGDVDLETSPRLQECLSSLVGDVVVDLTEVSFVDSSAIAVLIAEHKHRDACGAQLVITGSSPMALRVFEITGVDQVLNLNGDTTKP